MATYKGIDVSKHNGSINWKKAAAAIDFTVLRAGYGKLASQEDSCFEKNYAETKKQKLPVGVYWYSYAKTKAEAEEEAKACLAAIKGKSFDLPVYYDIEENETLKLGKQRVTAIARAFLSAIEAAGYKGGIYASKSTMETLIDATVKVHYSVWVAHVGKDGAALKNTSYKGKKDIWQYSWKGKVDGISGDVDLDYCYVDISKWKNEETETETKELKPVIEIAREVIDGKWGNGNNRKSKLKKAGYDYTTVQKEVNRILAIRAVAQDVINGKWGNGLMRRIRLGKAGYDYKQVQAEVNYLVEKDSKG